MSTSGSDDARSTHDQQQDDQQQDDQHLVRPRWVWGGLLLLLLGVTPFAIGLISLSWVLLVVGGLLLVLGAAASLRGGALYDVHGAGSNESELEQVRHGDVHPGIRPGDSSGNEEAREHAVQADRQRRRLLAAAAPRHVPLARPAGALVLAVAAMLWAAQGALFPESHTGQDNGMWAMGVLVVAALAGLRILLVGGRHLVAAAVVALCGVVLLLATLVPAHDSATAAWIEGGCAVLLLLAAAMAALAPERTARPGP